MTRNISIRLAVVVVILAMIVSALISHQYYKSIHAAKLADAKKNLLQLAKTVQRTASIAAYLDNMEIANDVLLGLAENEIVGGVLLTSKTGLNAGQGKSDTALQSKYEVTLPLISPFTPEDEVGELHIFPQQNLIEKSAREAALRQVLLLVAYTFIVALIVLSTMQFLFVRAIKNVADGLNTISPGDNTRLKSPWGHAEDEIGGLVKNTNHLLDLVSEKLAVERRLRLEVQSLERQFRMIYERAGVGIFLLDESGRLLMANKAFEEIVGPERYRAGKGNERDWIDDLFADTEQVRLIFKKTLLKNRLTQADLELKPLDATADPQWGHCLFNRIKRDTPEERSIFVQGIISDISERKKLEQKLSFQAGHDPLTGLMNRRAIEKELDVRLMKSSMNEDCVAVFLIDLDNFKPVNDTYGHDAGDMVLVVTAKRIKGLQIPHSFAGRLGGDEFLFVVSGDFDRNSLADVAKQLLSAIIKPVPIEDDTSVTIGASIGIALSTEMGTNRTYLMAMADKGLYHIKNTGKNRFWIEQPNG